MAVTTAETGGGARMTRASVRETGAGPREAGAPAPPGSSTLYLVKQLELAVRARLDDVLRPSGVTALQYTALSVLARQPTMSTSDLARASFVRDQSAADLVGVLERHGFVERSTDPTNRRRRLITLTPLGTAFLAEYDHLVAALEERMLHGLTAGEQDAFRGFLARGRRAVALEAVRRAGRATRAARR